MYRNLSIVRTSPDPDVTWGDALAALATMTLNDG